MSFCNKLSISIVSELIGYLVVDSHNQIYALRFCLGNEFEGKIQLVVFADRVTYLTALGFGEGISHSSCNNEVIDLIHQITDNVYLRTYLRTSHYRSKWAFGVIHHILDCVYLFFHQISEHLIVFVEEVGYYCCRSVCSVCCAEGIVYVTVCIRGECLCKLLLCLFHRFFCGSFLVFGNVGRQVTRLALFFGVEPKVFEHQSFSVFQRFDLFLGVAAVGGKLNLYTQMLRDGVEYLPQRKPLVGVLFGTSEVRGYY